MKNFLKIGIGIAIFCIVVVVAGGFTVVNLNQPGENIDREIFFSIKKGESLGFVAARLEKDKIIRSALLLRALCKISGTESSIKAGYYTIPVKATTMDIYKILLSGQQKLVKVTIPEGWSLLKIARYIDEKKITSKAALLSAAGSKELLEKYTIPGLNCEGYLFPDTYYFAEETSSLVVIDKMVSNFYKNLEKIVPDYETLESQEIYERITMASIVEREYRVAEEAKLMASVFYNRLKYSVGLESCATLEYIITDIQGKPHPEYITLKDKEIDSLYNTYKWHGLPPGPISNPGKVALDAAFHPAQTDYWFFLLKDKETGSHYFSKDLEEHIQAKYYYLKGYGKAP